MLVENFNSLTTHEQQQLADKWQLSPKEAYWIIIEVLKTDDADLDNCHTELVLHWEIHVCG